MKTESNYQYYADDYDYSSDDDYLNENEQVVHTIPQFTSTSSEMLINEGDTIKLPCFVDKLGKESVNFINSLLTCHRVAQTYKNTFFFKFKQ